MVFLYIATIKCINWNLSFPSYIGLTVEKSSYVQRHMCGYRLIMRANLWGKGMNDNTILRLLNIIIPISIAGLIFMLVLLFTDWSIVLAIFLGLCGALCDIFYIGRAMSDPLSLDID